jgi:hypothetical protein
MTDTEFVISSLITAYVLGWSFGSIILYFKKLVEVSTS